MTMTAFAFDCLSWESSVGLGCLEGPLEVASGGSGAVESALSTGFSLSGVVWWESEVMIVVQGRDSSSD